MFEVKTIAEPCTQGTYELPLHQHDRNTHIRAGGPISVNLGPRRTALVDLVLGRALGELQRCRGERARGQIACPLELRCGHGVGCGGLVEGLGSGNGSGRDGSGVVSAVTVGMRGGVCGGGQSSREENGDEEVGGCELHRVSSCRFEVEVMDS